MNLEYSHFDRSADLPQQRELFTLCFPESISAKTNSMEHYSWKFSGLKLTDNKQTSYEYVVKDKNKMLGYYAAIPYPYLIAGERQTVAMVCDVMTHPDARGQGIFTKVGKYATAELQKEDVAFSTGYPVRPEVIPGHLKVGWFKAMQLPVYLCPLRANAILSLVKMSCFAPLVNVLLMIFHMILALLKKPIKADWKIETIQTMQDRQFFSKPEYDDFFKAWAKTKINYLQKNADFLQWRLSAPNTDYTISYLHENTKILAVIISRKTDLHGIPSLAILDMMVLPEAKNCLPHLLQYVKNNAPKNGSEALAIMMNRSYFTSLKLLFSGFIPTHICFTLIIKIMNTQKSVAELSDDKNWCLTWIDSDDL